MLSFPSLLCRLTNSPMVAFGRSLGGAVSIALAERYPQKVKAVIIENSFLSVAKMVDILMPVIARLKWLVLRIKWDSNVKIQDLKQPIMFISGDADQLVPPAHMGKLHELATDSSLKDFYSVSGGGHNDTFIVAGHAYYEVNSK
jgi:abhydrolase domain-containing protein 13